MENKKRLIPDRREWDSERVKLFIFLPLLFWTLPSTFHCSQNSFAINYSPFPSLFMTLRRLHTHDSRDGKKKEKCNFSWNSTSRAEPYSSRGDGVSIQCLIVSLSSLTHNILCLRLPIHPPSFDVWPCKTFFIFIRQNSHLMQKVKKITATQRKTKNNSYHKTAEMGKRERENCFPSYQHSNDRSKVVNCFMAVYRETHFLFLFCSSIWVE